VSKLYTLEGDDRNILYTDSEVNHCCIHGDMPESFYRRNPHVDRGELSGIFSAIATFASNVVGKVIGGVAGRRKERRQAKQEKELATMTNQTALQQTQMETSAKQKTIIIPVAIGAAALIAVVMLMKKK